MNNKKIYIIANWKMQLLDNEAVSLAKEISKTEQGENVAIILCPSFTVLSNVGKIIKESNIKLGAQNVFYHKKGSYTGEVSPLQLRELDVEYVIVGHSERRQHLNETDEDVNRKVNVCLDNGLTPIVCVGETFEQRQMARTDLVLIKQVSAVMQDVDLNYAPKGARKLLVAYEPVWVIGSGQAVKPEEAEHASQVIKHTLLDFFDKDIVDENISVIYGGSVEAENVKDFIKPGLLDGVLVGGASLKAEEFGEIIKKVTSN